MQVRESGSLRWAVATLTRVLPNPVGMAWATKRRLAVVLGIFLGVAAHGAGFLPGEGTWGWVMAGLTGLLGTLGAAGVHGIVVKPLKGE